MANALFTVIPIPRIHHAFSNFIYVSERVGTFLQSPQYVVLEESNMIFLVKPNPDLKDSEIAMNSLQRRGAHLVNGQQIKLVPVDVTNEPCIDSARIRIDLKSKRHAIVFESDIIEFLLTKFRNHIFTENQELPIEFGTFTMTFVIDAIQNSNGVSIGRGILCSTTQLVVNPMMVMMFNPLLELKH